MKGNILFGSLSNAHRQAAVWVLFLFLDGLAVPITSVTSYVAMCGLSGNVTNSGLIVKRFGFCQSFL